MSKREDSRRAFSHHLSLITYHSSLITSSVPRLRQLVADADAVVGDDEEAARLVEREAGGRVGQHVAVLAQLVADLFGSLARVVDGEDATARALGQLLDDLVRLEVVAPERAARAVGNLERVDGDVLAQDFLEDLFEARLAAAV